MLTSNDIVPENFNYREHFIKYDFKNLLNLSDEKTNISEKVIYEPTFRVKKDNKIPLSPELDDLCRLHYIAIARKATTILEFGVGKSTIIMADALNINKNNYFEFTKKALRRNNLYEIHSIDNFDEWIKTCKDIMPNEFIDTKIVSFHYAKVEMGLFCDKICTFYESIPNICPDFIYLDAPCNYGELGDIRGISTNNQDRMAMAGDILAFEHFLLPGTMIVVDGRTANARFLACNFQRKWAHYHASDWDQHFFELQETPLGPYNERMITHCLGEEFFNRLSE